MKRISLWKTWLRFLAHHTQTLRRADSGSAMPVVAMVMFGLIGASGSAIDLGRVQIVQSRMVNALDAAGLAAGATISTTNVQTEARNYFDANFPSTYLGTRIYDFNVSVSDDNHIIHLSVKADVPTTFMQLFGKDYVTVTATSEITRASKGMELILVMDVTGSMLQSAGSGLTRLQAAKNAATTLLHTLFGTTNDTAENLWVGLVPFSQTVNIGVSRTNWLDNTFTSMDYGAKVTGTTCSSYNGTAGQYSSGPRCAYDLPGTAVPVFQQQNWEGCVEARSNGTLTPQYDINDDPPSVRRFRAYRWPNDSINNWYTSADNTNNHCTGSGSNRRCTQYRLTTYNYSYSSSLGDERGPNSECPQPITPMVASKSTVINAINNMTAQGNTHINLGLAWGWRMLSPRWRGLWGGEMDSNSLPLDYHAPLMNKVVILMTDGDNTVSSNIYSAYGYPSANQLGNNACNNSTCSNGVAQLNARTTAACNAMKANGILIYTIAFGTQISASSRALLEGCASKPVYYFYSPTGSDLQTAFQMIGDSLANLRVSQ